MLLGKQSETHHQMKEGVDVAPHSRALSVQRAYTSGTLQHAWKLSLLEILGDVWS